MLTVVEKALGYDAALRQDEVISGPWETLITCPPTASFPIFVARA